MKKITVIILFIFSSIIAQVYAENSGYIVKTKDSAVSLMCVSNELSYIGDNLYHADDIEAVYRFMPSENIEAVFPDYEFELFDTDYPDITSDTDFEDQWYLEKINAVAVREKGLSGAGVKIAVIDSGINISHPDFKQENILQGYNCIFGAEDESDYSDKVGHGTMVSGIIAAQTDNEIAIIGIAQNAQIIPIKVTDKNTLNFSSIFKGLEKALELDCDIINMSFGGPITDEEALAVLKSYIDEAEEKGIIVVAAVGNSGHTNNVMNYPAGFDNVIGVGAVDEELNAAYFSQKNESVFVVAPGNNIVSLSKDNSTANGIGTSLSAPIVTAVTAIIKEIRPEYSIWEIKSLLADTSEDLGAEGYDVNYGYGLLNAENIICRLNAEIPEIIVSQGIINSKKRVHIHNNSDSITADVYFADYKENNRLERIEIKKEVILYNGVTSIIPEKECKYFFLWDKNLRPILKKMHVK